jgi:hypothetical protein
LKETSTCQSAHFIWKFDQPKFGHLLIPSMEHYTRLCAKLRAKSQGNCVDHSALLLEDSTLARFADSLWRSSLPVPSLSLNLSLVGRSRRNGAWMPDGLDRLLQFIQTNTALVDVRLVGGLEAGNTTLLHSTVVVHFLDAIENNPSIQRLSLYNLDLEAESFARLIRRSRTIQHLSITHCTLYKRNGPKDEKIRTPKMLASFGVNKSITSLRLVDLNETLLLSILEQLKSHALLQKLDTTCGSALVANAIGQLIRGGNKSAPPMLHHLTLRNSSLVGLETMVRHWTVESPVHRLDVVQCSMDAVAISLFRTLFRSPKHRIQHISFCDVLLEEDARWEELFQGLLQSSPSLHQLTMHRVTLRDSDYRALKELLRCNKNLTQVNLDRTILAIMASDTQESRQDNSPPSTRQCNHFIYSRETGTLSPGFAGTIATI